MAELSPVGVTVSAPLCIPEEALKGAKGRAVGRAMGKAMGRAVGRPEMRKGEGAVSRA